MQYDAVVDDASGENSSPDFFWDSAARITDRGWIVEMRIPFATLRYKNVDPQTWGIVLFRNYPRQFRYQFMSMRVPARQQLPGLPRERVVRARTAAGRRARDCSART